MAEEKAKFKFPKRLIIVYATVFVDAFGYSFIMPILPYYTEILNGTAFELGVLLSIYALTQAFSCLIMGAGSDVFGRKFFLILSLFGSWTGPLIQSFAPTMILFIVFRGLTGLLGGSATVGQAYIADVVPVEYRANYLAQVGAILSCAFVIGPAFGGFLAEINIHMPFWFAAGCALIVFVISFWGIQETNQEVIRKRDLNNEKKKLLKKPGLSEEESKRLDEVNSELKSIEEEAKAKKEAPHEKLHWTPLMIVCLILKFFNESSAIIFDSVFLLYIKDMFQSTTLNNSILICTTGIISFLCPVLFFPLLHDKMKICVSAICIICSILMICGYLMMNFVPFLWFAYISCNVMFLGSSTIYNLPSVVISAQAPPSHQGQAISMVTMAAQCAYVAIPLIATAIYERNKQQALMLGLYFSIVVAILSTVLYFMPGGRTCENGKPEVEVNTEEEKKEEENVDIESKGEEILNTKAIQIEKTEKIEVPVAVISPETATSPAVISASDITPVKAIPVDVKPIQVN